MGRLKAARDRGERTRKKGLRKGTRMEQGEAAGARTPEAGKAGDIGKAAEIEAMTEAGKTLSAAPPLAAGSAPRRGALIGGLAGVALVLAVFGYWAMKVPAPVSVSAPVPVPAAAPSPAAAPEPAVQTPPAADIVSFDLLRSAPDGSVTLAGRAEPGARVEVLIDGATVDTVTAGADGSFVSLSSAAPSAVARQLQVRVTGADGVARLSAQSLTVAAAPEAAAAAAAAAGASPEQATAEAEAARAMAARPVIADADGARVLAPASDSLAIDTLSFDATGRVEISGRGAPAGTVLRAYVDNTEFGLVSPGADGAWRMALPAPGAGDHTLRVDALDPQGKVLGRAEQSFAGVGAPATLTAAAGTEGPKTRVIRIEKGATLWAIAREAYGDPLLYVRVFEANKAQIRDPDLIYPGQVFTVPQ